jgi:hypothetical protein
MVMNLPQGVHAWPRCPMRCNKPAPLCAKPCKPVQPSKPGRAAAPLNHSFAPVVMRIV